MNYEEKIKEAIDSRLNWKHCTHFYIGKTIDFENRRIDHLQGENNCFHYDYCWELSKGTPEQISKLENNLILYYKDEKRDKRLDNQNTGSAGNNKADTLYVAYCYEDETISINEIADDELPIKEGFPLNLLK